MRHLKTLLCVGIATFFFTSAYAQPGILGRMRRVGNNVADKIIDKKVDEAVNGQNNQNGNNQQSTPGSSSGNNPANTGGQGLISTPPDVNENLLAAENSFKGGKYGEARYAVQQAMLGVELQIGQKILKSMPETVAGLKKDTTQDQVTSTGWGWAGLTILRKYKDQSDKQFTITIANNAAWMSAINMYFNNPGFAQSTNGQQNVKQIMVNGRRSIIEFDKGSGYKISMPLGQTSLVIMEGRNFKTEAEITEAAKQINFDGIQALLGEK
jgi:hypothetical protein